MRFTNFISRTCLSIVALVFTAGVALAQVTTLINPLGDGGFELGSDFASNGWTVVNGTQPNKWFVGNAGTPLAGTNSAYISSSPSGATYDYDFNAPSVVHLYKDVTIPAGENLISLSFNWKGSGELTWDRFFVSYGPSTVTPVEGSPAPNGTAIAIPGLTTLFTQSVSATSSTAQSFALPASLAGTTVRLVFTWQNDDNTGPSPSAMIDNINMFSRAPGNFVSIASGTWTNTATWSSGIVPTAVDNVTITNGHNVVINTAAPVCNNLTVGTGSAATLTFSLASTLNVSGNLTVNSSALFNVFTGTAGRTVQVFGNVTNNGTINLSVTGALLSLAGSSPQTVSGSGTFSTNTIAQLQFNNTSTAIPSINWGFNNTIISTTLNWVAGTVNLGSNKMTLGTTVTSAGTLNANANVGFTSGTFSRWWLAAGTGTALAAGVDPTAATGRYPFIAANGANRSAYLSRTTPTAGGQISCSYADATSSTSTAFFDGAYAVQTRYNGAWTFGTQGTSPAAASHSVALMATGGLYVANGNGRVTLATAAAGGSHLAGTVAPSIQRSGMSLADLTTAPLYVGAASADVPFVSIASGNWNSGSTWNRGGAIPTSSDAVNVAPGHAVSVTGSSSALNVVVSALGTLNVQTGGTLDIDGAAASGVTNNGTILVSGGTVNLGPFGGGNRRFINSGTLTVSTGNLNINGNFLVNLGSVFNQSGGNINVDGNAAANAANSVLSGINIVQINPSTPTSVNLTGGTLTVVDPHVGAAPTDFAFAATGGANGTFVPTQANVTLGHTVAFGDGFSSDAGGNNASGFFINPRTSTANLGFAFGNIVINGPAGTNRYLNSSSTMQVQGSLTINPGGEYNSVSGMSLGGDLNNNGTFTSVNALNVGQPFYNGTGGSLSGSIVFPQTIRGNGVFRNSATAPTANFYWLRCVNPGGLTIATPLTISSQLQMTLGILTTSAANPVTLLSGCSITDGVSGTNFINGPISRVFDAGRVATGYNNQNNFAIGKGTSWLPANVDPAVSGSGNVTITAEAFTTNTGTPGTGVTSVSSNRWAIRVTGGSSNLLSNSVQLQDAGIASSNKILQAASASGSYDAIGPFTTYTAGTPNTLATSGSRISGAAYTGFFAYGNQNACVAPSAQPTSFVTSNVGATSLAGSFTAAAGTPTGYLVVRYPATATATNPVDNTVYAANAVLGAGRVVSASSALSFTSTGLTANTAYTYYVYAYNNTACFGPVYNLVSPLTTNVTTCPTAVDAPGDPYTSQEGHNYFVMDWAASTNVGATYQVDVATDNGFTSFVSGYQALPLGNGVTSLPVTGLTPGTTYFARVRAIDGCASPNTAVLTFTTYCAPFTSLPVTESFDNPFPCWSVSPAPNPNTTTGNGPWVTGLNSTFAFIGNIQNGANGAGKFAFKASNFITTSNLISNGYDLSSLGTSSQARINVFVYRRVGANSGDVVNFFVSNTKSSAGGTNILSINPRADLAPVVAASGWYQYTADIPVSYNTGGPVYFVIEGVTNNSNPQNDLGVDEFTVERIPCAQYLTPPTVNTSTMTGNQATVNWINSGTATGPIYVEYGPSATFTTPGTGATAGANGTVATVTAGSTSYTIMGLMPTTGYRFFVRQACDNSNTLFGSNNTVGVRFTTPSCATFNTLPTVSNLTSTSAQANWVNASTNVATGPIIVEYGLASNFTVPGSGATAGTNGTVVTVTAGSTSLNITGLTGPTGYRFYVRQACDNSMTTFGPNSTVVNFTTVSPFDVRATALLSPVSGQGCYSASENVSVTIRNSGDPLDFSVNNVTVTLAVSGATTSSNQVVLTSGTLAANATMNVSMGTLDMTTTGVYTFNATATVASDANTGNDAMNSVIINNAGTVAVGTVSSSTNAICVSGTPTLTYTGSLGTGITWTESSSPTGPWNTVATGTTSYTPSVAITANTYYQVSVSCNATAFPSNVVTVSLSAPTAGTAVTATRCGAGTVAVSVTGNSNPVSWYAAATGGVALGTGNSFTTPVISAPTTYYAQATSNLGAFTLGEPTRIGLTAFTSAAVIPYVTYFSTQDAVNITSFQIYTNAISNVTVTLRNASGAAVDSRVFLNLPSSVNALLTLGVNFEVPANSNNWSIAYTVSGTAVFVTGTVNYPYQANGFAMTGNDIDGVSVIGGTRVSLFNMVLNRPCLSPRVAVLADVTSAPAITVTPATSTVCAGLPASFSVSSGNTNYAYAWSNSLPAGASQTVSPTVTSTYTVTASDAGTGCTVTASALVNASPLPSVPSFTPASPQLCPGFTQTLAANSLYTATAQVGTGTVVSPATNFPNPLNSYYGGAKHQMLYRVSDLTSQGMTANSQITSVAFDISALSAGAILNQFTIRMAHTGSATLAGFVPGTTTVYQATVSPSATGWITFNLTTPFTWNGTSNIVLETVHNAANVGSGAGGPVTRSTQTAYNSVFFGAQDNVTPAGVAAFDANTVFALSGTSNNRPNVRFGFGKPATLAWTPNASLFSNAAATNLYAGANAATVYAKPSVNTSYSVLATTPFGCTSSNSVTVSMRTPINTTVTPQAAQICTGASTNIVGSQSAGTYSWSTGANTQSITVNTTDSYRVTYTDTNGCTSTAGTSVFVSAPVISIASTPTSASVPQGTALASTAGGVSPYTYRWSTGSTSGSINGVPGAYFVTSTDGIGCTSTTTARIFSNQPLTNNQPCNFTYFWPQSGAVVGSTNASVRCYSINSNNIGADANNEPSNCGTSGDKGVWYFFRMPGCAGGGNSPLGVKISTNNIGTGLAGTNLGVYSVTNSTSCTGAGFNLIACSNSSSVAGCSGSSGSSNHGTLEFGPGAANGPLQDGGNYFIYVSGDNGAEGNFELSFEYTGNRSITVTAGPSASQAVITVPNNGQSSFKPQWRPMGSTGWASTNGLVSSNTFTLPANTLMPGVTYEFSALYACATAYNYVMASNITTFATTPTVATCAPVSGLTCNAVGGNVTTTWNAAPAGTTGNLVVVARSGSRQLVGTVAPSTATGVTLTCPGCTATNTSFTLQSSCGGSGYIASGACAVSAAGQASAVQTVSFIHNGISYEGVDFNDAQWGLFGAEPTGDFVMTVANGELIISNASESVAGFDFELRPSVATDFTNVVISTEKAVDAQLSISDMNGSVLDTRMMKGVQNGTVVTLETRELAAGLYIVSVRTEEGNVAKKLVVVK